MRYAMSRIQRLARRLERCNAPSKGRTAVSREGKILNCRHRCDRDAGKSNIVSQTEKIPMTLWVIE